MASTFWSDLGTFCSHLAPVVGPLVEKVGATAVAIDNAQKEIAALDQDIAFFKGILPQEDKCSKTS